MKESLTEEQMLPRWRMLLWTLQMLPRWWWRGHGWNWDVFATLWREYGR